MVRLREGRSRIRWARPREPAEDKAQSFTSVRSTSVEPTAAPGSDRFLSLVKFFLPFFDETFDFLQCAFSEGEFIEKSGVSCGEGVKFEHFRLMGGFQLFVNFFMSIRRIKPFG